MTKVTASLEIERTNGELATFTFPCKADATAGIVLNSFEDALIALGWEVEL